ncbi:hypothetical protein [Dyadobacter sp. CY343]|uniref:hypothetical protein n=1 Tax=Dyadobacter sp. CY343 TaxID=2907299 RepID=UPI001F242AF6|nr:hypothetical protein [Dyadobacter sp. CY343]MCE7061229.1 hypothetical protein [Dyadobacter sp. CY343]
MNGGNPVQPNSLKKLYNLQRMSVRSAIREELEDRGQTYQRLAHWMKVDDAELIRIPLILKEIVCKYIPAAEPLFKLPEINQPVL